MYTHIKKEELEELRKKDISLKEIAEHFNVSISTIEKRLKKWGLVRNLEAPIEERLLRNLKPTSNKCWEWQGNTVPRGYGMIKAKDRRNIYTHRLSYEMHNGPIPDGLLVRHLCHNPRCCNPAHLALGTQKDNMRDAMKRGTHPSLTQGRGPDAFGAKHTYELLAYAKRLRRDGWRFTQIGDYFGLDESTVRRWVRK